MKKFILLQYKSKLLSMRTSILVLILLCIIACKRKSLYTLYGTLPDIVLSCWLSAFSIPSYCLSTGSYCLSTGSYCLSTGSYCLSSVNDMAQWIILHLNNGKTDKENIFSAKIQEEMWQLQTPSNISSFARELWPSTHFKGYGMGWSLLNYHGKRIVGHNGGYDGMISQTTIIPEENMGFVILTNANSSMYYPLMYYVLDILLAEEDTDWNSLFHNYSERQKIADIESNIANEEMRIKDSNPSLELKGYTGTYYSEVYGEAKISFKEESLYFNMLESDIFESNMTHWQYNTFSIKFSQVPSLPLGTINFLINAEGNVYEMQVDVPNPDFDFTELVFIKK